MFWKTRIATYLFFTIGALLCIPSSSAQQPNSWHGLTLGESTIEEAIAILGTPKKVKENQKLSTPISAWIDKSVRYTKIYFRQVPGFKQVILFFSEDRLTVIQLHFRQKLNPSTLSDAYGIQFVPKVSGIDVAFNPEDYERNQGQVYPTNYPDRYHLIGISEEAYVVGQVTNRSVGAFFKDVFKVPDDSTSFPGKVEALQLVSTFLRDRQGVSVLE